MNISRGYLIYIVLIAIVTIPMLLAPFLFYNDLGTFETIHGYYSPLCHQITSRSFCFFPETGAIEDCYSTSELVLNKEIVVEKNGIYGYKFPVCSRDVSFYLFALIGGIYLFAMGMQNNTKVPHPLFLIIAIIPLALDGGTQFIGLRESTNLIRFITGAIAGFVIPFYLVPMINRIVK